MNACHMCGSVNLHYLTKYFPSKCTIEEIQDKHYPEFSFHVMQYCNDCGTFSGNKTHCNALIDSLNEQTDVRKKMFKAIRKQTKQEKHG